jgi:hypothetical protein
MFERTGTLPEIIALIAELAQSLPSVVHSWSFRLHRHWTTTMLEEAFPFCQFSTSCTKFTLSFPDGFIKLGSRYRWSRRIFMVKATGIFLAALVSLTTSVMGEGTGNTSFEVSAASFELTRTLGLHCECDIYNEVDDSNLRVKINRSYDI